MARPQYKPTDEARKQVSTLAAYGIPHLDIAKVIGVSRRTLEKYYRKELDIGHVKANAKVAQTLYNKAVGGNITACIFWMKARAGWSEKVDHKITGYESEEARERRRTIGKRLTDQSVIDQERMNEATEQTFAIIETYLSKDDKGEFYTAEE